MFRPFPNEEIRTLAGTVDRIGVADRSYTFGPMGAAATEVSAAPGTRAREWPCARMAMSGVCVHGSPGLSPGDDEKEVFVSFVRFVVKALSPARPGDKQSTKKRRRSAP
jgi:hypothetical protein